MSKPINFSYSNTLTSTRQPMVDLKPKKYENGMPSTSPGIVASMSRPNVNLGHNPQTTIESNYNTAVNFRGPFRKAYPMKHWRKQLTANGKSGRTANSISDLEKPGGSVFRGYTDNNCDCNDSNNNQFVTFDNKFLQSPYSSIKPSSTSQPVSGTINNKIQNNGLVQVGDPNDPNSYQIQTGIYNTKNMCSTPQRNNVIKSASTIISKSYYTDSKAYLKARCKSFEQKQSIQEIPGNTYNSKTIAENSTQFQTNNCTNTYQTGRNCKNVTYYKPNNTPFAKQGAVSSSTRMLKLNKDTITLNGNSFKSAWGDAAANAGKYHGESMSPYFVKNKNSKNLVWSRTGNKQICKDKCGKSQTLSSFWHF